MDVKKMKIRLIAILGILIISLFMTGCNSNASSENLTGNIITTNEEDCSDATICNIKLDETKNININKLEIYHFHGTNQCTSCIAVGDLAEETVNTYFKEELEKGIIVFDHINGELPENRDLVIQYGATGSSLWLGTYKGDEFKAEENVNVWYKIQDKTAYMNYLKGVIEQKLAGN